ESHYYTTAIVTKTNDHLQLAVISWPKEPLDIWLARLERNLAATATAAPRATYTLPMISDDAGCIGNTWTATAGSPDSRQAHTAVWTGTEMIVWGGSHGNLSLDTGGRYNPNTNSWTATSTTNAPFGRRYHTAAWTGSEMIVWGGTNNLMVFDTGGRYNPGTNSWTATSTTNPPAARYFHRAVWTGSEMIIW